MSIYGAFLDRDRRKRLSMAVGDTVRIDFPGHVHHGQTARLVDIEDVLDTGHPVYFVDWGLGPRGIGRERLRPA